MVEVDYEDLMSVWSRLSPSSRWTPATWSAPEPAPLKYCDIACVI